MIQAFVRPEIVTSPVSVPDTSDAVEIPQYSLRKILGLWAAAAIPMGLLGWVVAPTLGRDAASTELVRLAGLTVGLVWQFVIVVWMLYRETGTFSVSVLRRRLWLNSPRDPKTGLSLTRLWLWLVPILLLTFLFELVAGGGLDRVVAHFLPFLIEPQGFALSAGLATPEAQAQLAGAWSVLILYVVEAGMAVLSEELLFRGLLLPRMAGRFGKWDWVANGLLFGLYHLHEPWTIPAICIEGMLLLAFPSRRWRSAWFGILVHAGQSLFFAVLILGLVLGSGR